jgi:two-component system, cell cycle response regulator
MTSPSRNPRGPGTLRPSAVLTVLVVDDDDALRTLTSRWLTKSKMDVIEAASGEAAIAALTAEHERIDAVVLDVMLPGIDGFQTLERIRALPAGSQVPVVLLTAHATGDKDVVRGIEAGAFDHLSKPFSGPVLVAKVRRLCERGRGERELRRQLFSAEKTATIDVLTGLANRRNFEARLREETANAKRRSEPFSLVLLDLDHFKSINDTFGHDDGDRVLVHFAQVLRDSLRAEDAAFRYGGEEFVLLFRGCTGESAVLAVDRIRATLAAMPIELGDKDEPRHITFSAGVAAATAEQGFEADKLVVRADEALYRAKRSGRNRVELAPV